MNRRRETLCDESTMELGKRLMMFFGLLLTIGIAVLAVWLFRQSGAGRGRDSEETPLEILEKRYAKGEIDKQEFEQKRRDLM